MQSQDLEEFFESIGRDLEKMQIKQAVPNFVPSEPPNSENSYFVAFDTRRGAVGGRLGSLNAFHNNAIFVFPDSESAHDYFLIFTQDIDETIRMDLPTIGDESIAFSGYFSDSGWPVGGVVWRYQKVFVFFSAQLFFQVTSSSVIDVAENIQARLAEVLTSTLTLVSTPTDTQAPLTTNTPTTNTDAFSITLWMGQRQSEIESPEMYWDVQAVASQLGVDPPPEGYWPPEDIYLEIFKSASSFDSNQYNSPMLYTIEVAIYQDGSIITGVVFSNPGGAATYNFENQFYHPSYTVESDPYIELGIAPLVVMPPIMLKDLAPGYYAVRIRINDYTGDFPLVTVSNWVIFQMK